MAKNVIGLCKLCGKYKKLSKEHIPPRAAFNAGDYKIESINRYKTKSVNVWQTVKRQGGHFSYVLCEQCNNQTGQWYVREYAKLANACAPYAIPKNATQVVPISLSGLFPLRVFKEALTIMCATIDTSPGDDWQFVNAPSNPSIGLAKPDADISTAINYLPALREFVLAKEVSGLTVPVKLYTYLVCDFEGRTTGVAKRFNKNTGASLLFAEFSWWPLGWVLVFEGQLSGNLLDVTDWSQRGYDEEIPITLNIPCLWVKGRAPLTFMSPEQLALLRAKNQAVIDSRQAEEKNPEN